MNGTFLIALGGGLRKQGLGATSEIAKAHSASGEHHYRSLE